MGEGIDGIIIDGINGYLVNVNDVIGLADKLEKCFQLDYDEKTRLQMRMNESAQKYSEKGAGMHYLELIKNVC